MTRGSGCGSGTGVGDGGERSPLLFRAHPGVRPHSVDLNLQHLVPRVQSLEAVGVGRLRRAQVDLRPKYERQIVKSS